MKASVQYNDFTGTAAADISDFLSKVGGDKLKSIGRHFELNEDRFEVIAISVNGVEEFSVALICVDKQKSTAEKEHIVKIDLEIEDPEDILDLLFKRLEFVLHNKHDERYLERDYNEEANLSDFQEN